MAATRIADHANVGPITGGARAIYNGSSRHDEVEHVRRSTCGWWVLAGSERILCAKYRPMQQSTRDDAWSSRGRF